MNRLVFLSLCSIILLLVVSPAVNAQPQKYGEVDLNVSCDEAVQADFDRALAMLHNMMYVKAREVFGEITEADPNCAMAYWGVATTLFQPLWSTRPSEEELEQGWQNSQKAVKLAETDKEKYLAESTAAFFRDPQKADFSTRINRWINSMEEAYKAYPEDPEIAAFYGLTRVALAQTVEDRDPHLDEAEAVLRNIYEQIPTHPGAIHYSIHATDVDGRAENALDMVEAYGKIAPEIPHALHMPTHIYVRLGDWPEIINWNQKSAEAALNFPANGDISHHYIHAIDYLVYAHLQRGEDDKIESIVEEAWSKDRYQQSFISAYHFAAIPARLAVERRDWEKAKMLEPRTPEYLPWDDSSWAEGLTWFAQGLGTVHTGDIEAARKSEQRLKELREKAEKSGSAGMATYIEIDRLVLDGWIAYAKGNSEEAVNLISEAAELEETVEKHPVTPGALLPPNEALGDLLMELDRPEKALQAYEDSDAIWPKRYNTLLGAARAAHKIGDKKTAREYSERLLDGIGNSDRSTLNEVRTFAGIE